jgi:predicted MFS family arabinose efflux permease
MNGVGGKTGWAWIFILEGLITVFVAIASYWMVHDFPDNATFLTPDDRARVIRRLAADQQASAKHENFDRRYAFEALRDWKTYAFMIVYMGTDGPLYAFSLFLPTIIKAMGNGKYSATKTNLLSVPPYAVAAIMTIAVGAFADRTRKRGLANIFTSLLAIIGFGMLLGSQNAHVKYAGVFLGAAGIYPTIANTISWCSNNIEGVYKRGVVLGMVIG